MQKFGCEEEKKGLKYVKDLSFRWLVEVNNVQNN